MTWCDVLQHVVMWCHLIRCDAMWCDVVWGNEMGCDEMQCNVMWGNMMWYDVMWCEVIYCDILYQVIISSSVMSRMTGQHHLPCYFPRNQLKYKYVQFPLCRIQYCRSAHNLLCEEEEEVCFTNIKDNASLPQIFFTRSIIVPLFV